MDSPPRLWVRTPLIPGATATDDNIRAIGEFLVPAVAECADVGQEVADSDLGFDDAEVLVDFLEQSSAHNLGCVRIIHGKGTFALRNEVARLLRSDRRVAGLRSGGFEEGGSGVTVVEFLGGGD